MAPPFRQFALWIVLSLGLICCSPKTSSTSSLATSTQEVPLAASASPTGTSPATAAISSPAAVAPGESSTAIPARLPTQPISSGGPSIMYLTKEGRVVSLTFAELAGLGRPASMLPAELTEQVSFDLGDYTSPLERVSQDGRYFAYLTGDLNATSPL